MGGSSGSESSSVPGMSAGGRRQDPVLPVGPSLIRPSMISRIILSMLTAVLFLWLAMVLLDAAVVTLPIGVAVSGA